MKLNPTPPDPIQAKVMMAMPIIFTFMFLWFPSGLVLYWVVNNCLSIAQQWQITRMIESAGRQARLTRLPRSRRHRARRHRCRPRLGAESRRLRGRAVRP
jgi:membrane protein insertase Oxa1/YidC/SpoIIIJ